MQCLRTFNILISRSAIRRTVASSSVSRNFLTATIWSDSRWRHFITSPYEPSPTTASCSYFSILRRPTSVIQQNYPSRCPETSTKTVTHQNRITHIFKTNRMFIIKTLPATPVKTYNIIAVIGKMFINEWEFTAEWTIPNYVFTISRVAMYVCSSSKWISICQRVYVSEPYR